MATRHMTSWFGDMQALLVSRELGVTSHSHIPKGAGRGPRLGGLTPTLELHPGAQLLAGEHAAVSSTILPSPFSGAVQNIGPDLPEAFLGHVLKNNVEADVN